VEGLPFPRFGEGQTFLSFEIDFLKGLVKIER